MRWPFSPDVPPGAHGLMKNDKRKKHKKTSGGPIENVRLSGVTGFALEDSQAGRQPDGHRPPFHTLATSMDCDGRRAHGDRRSLVARKFGDCREQPETLHSVDED